MTDRIELRSRAQTLALEGDYAAAVPLLDEAAALYREAADTAKDPTSDLLSLVFLTYHQIHCDFAERKDASYLRLIRHLTEAADLRRRLSSPEVTEQWWVTDAVVRRGWREQNASGLLNLTRFLETWRSRLEKDWHRIEALENAAPAHSAFVSALYDLGALPEAFAAAEMSRARALADRLADGRDVARALTPSRLREALAGRSVVSYFLDGERLLIFSLRPDGTVEGTEADGTGLTGTVARLHELTEIDQTDATLPEVDALLERLGGLLVDRAPWLPENGEPVLLVPHGVLFQVPFAAVITRSGQRLAERHPTSVLPAASLLPRRRARAPQGMFALVSPRPMPDGLPDLPLLERRFPAIAEAFPGTAQIHAGEDATAERLGEVAEMRPSVLCLATHGMALGGDEALDSFLAVAGARLTARHVSGMHLPADVVILAACETGRGRISADGVVGLGRSFLVAGAGAVLMTLWKGTERESLAVLRRFLEHHAAGAAPSAALRSAQLDLVSGDPRAWSSFVLFGTPD